MECIINNSIILTIAIQMHGKVIDLDLTPKINKIFENIRLYSHSGTYKDVLSTYSRDVDILYDLNKLFQKDLTNNSIEPINEYITSMKPNYEFFLKSRASHEYTAENIEQVCQIYDNIVFDKSFSTSTYSENPILCFFEQLLPEIQGIFIVSIHEKNKNNYKLIYPHSNDTNNSSQNLNLLNIEDFQKFAGVFNKILPNIEKISFSLPVNEYVNREKEINNNKSFTENEKSILIKSQKNEFYEILKSWKITMKNSKKIESIRMSFLVELLKNILGNNSYINIFDYSCSSITKYIPEEDLYYSKYLTKSDIEKPINKNWGGSTRKTRKHKKHKKNKKKSSKKTIINKQKYKTTYYLQ